MRFEPYLLLLAIVALGAVAAAVIEVRHRRALARARADFIASVSHQLRTPLTQIRMYLEMMQLGRAPDGSLDLIERETQRLTHLIENVLLFSSGMQEATTPAEERVANAMVQEIAAEFEPLARARRVSLDLRMDADAATTLPYTAVRYILFNLLDNAVKYGPAGQTVVVRARAEREMLRLTVADQGPGMPVAARDSLWQPFQRGTEPAVLAAGGSGIGLTVVRQLAETLDGRVRVDDAPGGGAAFHVDLPLRPAAAVRTMPGEEDHAH